MPFSHARVSSVKVVRDMGCVPVCLKLGIGKHFEKAITVSGGAALLDYSE